MPSIEPAGRTRRPEVIGVCEHLFVGQLAAHSPTSRVFAPFDGPRRVCTRYEKFEERGHAHLPSITSIRHEKLFQVFTFDIDVHCGPRYAINSEESDAPSVTKMALGVTIRATVHVNIKGKDLKQLLVTYTCDAEQMSMSSLLKFLIPSANSSRTVERRENVRLGCELRVD